MVFPAGAIVSAMSMIKNREEEENNIQSLEKRATKLLQEVLEIKEQQKVATYRIDREGEWEEFFVGDEKVLEGHRIDLEDFILEVLNNYRISEIRIEEI